MLARKFSLSCERFGLLQLFAPGLAVRINTVFFFYCCWHQPTSLLVATRDVLVCVFFRRSAVGDLFARYAAVFAVLLWCHRKPVDISSAWSPPLDCSASTLTVFFLFLTAASSHRHPRSTLSVSFSLPPPPSPVLAWVLYSFFAAAASATAYHVPSPRQLKNNLFVPSSCVGAPVAAFAEGQHSRG